MSFSKPVWSYCNTPLQTPFLYQTIPEKIAYFANLHPNKEAFVDIDGNGKRVASITFGELYETSVCFAKGLLELGIEKGDVVAIVLPNCVEWLVCTFGTLLAGGIPIYLNYLTKDGNEVTHAIKKSEKCIIFITEAGSDEKNVRICEKIFGNISSKGSIRCDNLPFLKRIVFRCKMLSLNDQMLIQDIVDVGKLSNNLTLPTVYPEDIAAYHMTTGTSGLPNIVPKTHMYFLQLGRIFIKCFDLSAQDIDFNFQEMGWGGAYPYFLFELGITRVSCTLDVVSKSTDLAALTVNIIHQEKCTFTMLHPKLIMSILDKKYHVDDGWRLRIVWSSGVPIPSRCASIVPYFAEMFINAYGTTEIGVIAINPVKTPLDFKDFQVGRPVEGTEIKIVNNDGSVVPFEVVGEILVRRQIPFSGYINSSRHTDARTAPFGWYKTGDHGYMEKTGKLIITGRKAESIKVSNNIVDDNFPTYAVEKEIGCIDGVEDVCVVPYTDERKFTTACACIERSPSSKLTEKDVENLMKNKMSGDAFSIFIPTHYVFFEKLPRNSRGKIQRSDVAKAAKRMIEGDGRSTFSSKLTEKDVENLMKNKVSGDAFSIFIPTHYVFFEKLPRNSRGKIQRSDVAKAAKRMIEG